MSLDGVLHIPFGETSIYPGSRVEMMLYTSHGSLHTGVFDVLILKAEYIHLSLMSAVNCPTARREMLQDMLDYTTNKQSKEKLSILKLYAQGKRRENHNCES